MGLSEESVFILIAFSLICFIASLKKQGAGMLHMDVYAFKKCHGIFIQKKA